MPAWFTEKSLAGLQNWVWIAIAVVVVLVVVAVILAVCLKKKHAKKAQPAESYYVFPQTQPAATNTTKAQQVEPAATDNNTADHAKATPVENTGKIKEEHKEEAAAYTKEKAETPDVKEEEMKEKNPAPVEKKTSEKPAPAATEKKTETPAKPAPAAKPAEKQQPEVKLAEKPAKPESNRPKVYHISLRKSDGMWQVKAAGAEKAIKLFKTQAEAIEYCKPLAVNQEANIMIHKKDGSFRKLTY